MSQPKIIADQIDSTNLVADELDNLDSTDFASSTHNHDANYSALGHNHNTDYYTQSQLNGGQLDSRYYTESEVDSLISGAGGGFSSGQTWQDVKVSRSKNITYTNTTGYPIEVMISSEDGLSVFINGSGVGSSGSNEYVLQTFIVPNGNTYEVNCGTVNAGITKWWELR